MPSGSAGRQFFQHKKFLPGRRKYAGVRAICAAGSVEAQMFGALAGGSLTGMPRGAAGHP
jgi:hypothetical protein